MSDLPFVAVGNDELGEEVNEGDLLVRGEDRGVLRYAKDEQGAKTSKIGFVSVPGGGCYLASIDNKLVFGWGKA